MITCKLCGEGKEEKNFKFEDGKVRKRTCYSCIGRRERAKLKLDMLRSLGDFCKCCGENHPTFLTLDHVHGDGAKLRATRVERIKAGLGMEVDLGERAWNSQQQMHQARREGWPKDRYQVLCMNCNFAKGHYKECPHQQGITRDMALETLNRNVKTYMRSRHDYQASYNGNQHGKLR